MFWTHWGWLELSCYTGIIILVSSTVTAYYMLQNQTAIKNQERKLDKAKTITAYKLKDKPWWYIRFHRPGEIPQDAERRIYPPLHPGGPVEKEIDTFIMAKMSDGKSRKEAWEEAILEYYPDNARTDKIYMRGEFNNMKKRIEGRYSKTGEQ